MSLFKDMGICESLLKALDRHKFVQPTPIQLQSIPTCLEGKDLIGSAQTGTGKTLAFVIPIISHLLENPKSMALVLTPTRELAQQVSEGIKLLLGGSINLRVAQLIGGEPIFKQFKQLRAKPQIIIGTPGRVIDHMDRATLTTNRFSFLVLDETDRMFDMGFGIQLNDIIQRLPTERQTLMFSATFPPKIEKLAQQYMINPHRVFIESKITISENLKQEVISVKDADKYGQLLTELSARDGSIIVFVKTKINADRIADKLSDLGHDAVAIHGDLKQSRREKVMTAFRKGRYRILIATDVAARGLDVPHLQHVINYDLPQAPEDYIHRIGRTARNQAEGHALTFLSPRDGALWNEIQRLIYPDRQKTEKFAVADKQRKPKKAFSSSRKPSSFKKKAKGKPEGDFGKPQAKKFAGSKVKKDRPKNKKASGMGPIQRKK